MTAPPTSNPTFRTVELLDSPLSLAELNQSHRSAMWSLNNAAATTAASATTTLTARASRLVSTMPLLWHNDPLAIGTDYDSFEPEAALEAFESGPYNVVRRLRRLLASTMTWSGFARYSPE